MSSNIENFFHIMGFNNQAKEWLGVDRTSKIIWFQPPFCGQGCQPLNQALDQVAQGTFQWLLGQQSRDFSTRQLLPLWLPCCVSLGTVLFLQIYIK